MRARHPGAILVRVIHLDKGLQYFLQLNPTPERRAEAEFQDGATVVTPSVPGGRDTAEIDLLIAQADTDWEALEEGRA